MPVIESVPLDRVAVKFPLADEPPLVKLEVGMVPVKLPLPMFVAVNGPDMTMFVASVTVALVTVMVVLIVAACAAADKTTQAKSKRMRTPLLVVKVPD
ncbi:MAG TPA: hypothetical protein VLW65_02385 [Bryobacteraceae bacterium]|nr:hypothetical protein [Bryobacteraceae bacterium]